LLERVGAQLPKVDAEQRPRGVRVVEFLERYAPDPHTVLLRVALRTGLPADALANPAALSLEQVGRIEEAACRILGIAKIDL
jgi:thioredoxin-like negative regulator of GroEL